MNPIEQADDVVQGGDNEPLSLEEYIDEDVSERESVEYLLDAIEYYGTRTVIENGEEVERYRFWDDPNGDGEHALLGHSEVLNDLVEDIRRMASEEGENEKILWIEGPTASGKSEFKRCLINGLRGYSQTDEGRRYTVEWSIDRASDNQLGYVENSTVSQDWYRSPVNSSPLSIFPEEVREECGVENELDPFSREAYQYLMQDYPSFSDATSSDHLRVVPFEMGVGSGIGVLQSEDVGNVKQKLVGNWMNGAMEKFALRGRKNPQAFSYDGLLGQGNRGVSILEDARHHFDSLQKLLNVVEEETVKLDNKISMDIDTLMCVISNPDLENLLFQRIEEQGDPHRALRRRMIKYDIGYLTNLSLEVQLLRRLLCDSSELWDDEEALDRVREPLHLYGCEFTPHAIETAAMYNILTRIQPPDGDLNKIQKALALDRGYHEENNERTPIDELDLDVDFDGEAGAPPTYTVDKLVDLSQEEEIVTPKDIVQSVSNFSDSTIFSDEESRQLENLKLDVWAYAQVELREDVLEAMVGDSTPTEEEVSEYVEGVFNWSEEEDEEYDPYELREFEKLHFAFSDDDYYGEAKPRKKVKKFREDKITHPINSYIWDNKDESFEVDDLPLQECPTIESLLGELSFNDVEIRYENFNSSLWRNPPEGSETEELKEKTIDRMVEDMDYTERSAERISEMIVNEVVI